MTQEEIFSRIAAGIDEEEPEVMPQEYYCLRGHVALCCPVCEACPKCGEQHEAGCRLAEED